MTSAAVIDARIRRRHDDLVPLPAAAWSAQVPETDDPERRRFLTQLAAVMDDRRRRIGEHAAASSLPWAVTALGTVPDDPAERLAWQQKAAAIGAYRELSGHLTTRTTRSAPSHREQPGPARRLARGPCTPSPRTTPGTAAKAGCPTWRKRPAGSRNWPPGAASSRPGWPNARACPSPPKTPAPRRQSRLPPCAAHSRTAILQPPKPEIPVSPWILERLADRDLDHEAGG